MKLRACIVSVALLVFAASRAWAGDDAASHFRPLNVYVDSGTESLAAYQIEITAAGSTPCGEVVGVEGGEHHAFRAAPYYDPAALRGGRIIIGALSTDSDLPKGKTRVAVLHMRESSPCQYKARVLAAASEREDRASVQVWVEPVNGGSDE